MELTILEITMGISLSLIVGYTVGKFIATDIGD